MEMWVQSPLIWNMFNADLLKTQGCVVDILYSFRSYIILYTVCVHYYCKLNSTPFIDLIKSTKQILDKKTIKPQHFL